MNFSATLPNYPKFLVKFLALCFFFLLGRGLNAQSQTEVLILGTNHLGNLKKFNPDMLDKLIAKLEDYHFDAVAIENMPAQLLYDIQSRQDSAYTELLNSWGGERLELAKSTQRHLEITLLEAQHKANTILPDGVLNRAERERLIQYFVASADLASATLQYQYIPKSKEKGTLSFYDKITNKLEELSGSSNEIYSIAVRLAHNRGLQRIEYIDDFQDEAMLLKNFPKFVPDYMANQELFKHIGSLPVYQKTDSLLAAGIQNNNLLDLYLFTNSVEFQKQDFEAQWKIWLETNFPSGSDRARYDLWEMRNLQITANILKTSAFYPGKKILVIIGASHKSFLEKYLRQVPDINLLEFN